MATVHPFRRPVDDAALEERRRAWAAAATVRENAQAVKEQLEARERREAQLVRRDRRRRLLERGAAAAILFVFWFGFLLPSLRWPYAAAVALAITTVLCALLAAFGELPPEDLGRVRPGRRR